jgi:hypothetical protein
MIYWIRKAAILLGHTVFFGVLFVSLASSADPFDFGSLIMCIIKALIGGGLFWFAGYILGDIMFKGVLNDIEVDKANMLEGGLIQRINEKHENALPGGPDMPLIDEESGLPVEKIKTENKIKKLRGA